MANNFTFFFNIDSNGTTAVWLRSIFPFRQENGLTRGEFPYEDNMLQSAPLPRVSSHVAVPSECLAQRVVETMDLVLPPSHTSSALCYTYNTAWSTSS